MIAPRNLTVRQLWRCYLNAKIISEEEANRIVDQIESVRTSIVEQFQQIQQKVQSVVDGVFAKVRNYLNSLDRLELNYEGIKQDFAKVFDDPQAGFEALCDRLSEFDRDTLVAPDHRSNRSGAGWRTATSRTHPERNPKTPESDPKAS